MFGLTLPSEAAERSRATMWDVPRFAERHPYRAIVVENVVEVTRWPLWESWCHAMRALDYRLTFLFLNSAHAQGRGLPAPQSRDRIYVVAVKAGERTPTFDLLRPAALCPTCGPIRAIQSFKNGKTWGRYRAQYLYRCPNGACRHTVVEPAWLPAAAAIDWSIPGQRIGDRDRPLAAKTMARIRAGLDRYRQDPQTSVPEADEPGTPMLVPAGGSWSVSAQPVTVPMRARTTRESEGLLVPVEGRDGKHAQPTVDPLRTLTSRSETGLVVMMRGTNQAKSTEQVMDTVAASGNHHALITRHNTERGGGGHMSTPIGEPLRTLTAGGNQSLLQWGQLIIDYNGPARPVDQPLPTQTTIEGNALASSPTGVADCLFRMLEPTEIARGMAFPDTYKITGNRREQVRQAGNAVTPPAARDILAAIAEAFTVDPAA